MARKSSVSTFALLGRLPGQIARVVKAEIGNAKEEVGGRIKNLVIAIVLFVIALIVLFWTIAVLLAAAVAGIAEALPVWLSALIIGGAGLLTIAICVVVGIVLIKRGSPVPAKTIARMKTDIAAAKEVAGGAKKMKAQPGKIGTDGKKQGVWQ